MADTPPGFRVEPDTVLAVESTGVSVRLGYRTPEGGTVVYITPARADRFTASFYIPKGGREDSLRVPWSLISGTACHAF